MATNAYTVGPGTLNLGEVEDVTAFAAQITSAKVTPTVDKGDAINTLDGGQVPGDRTEAFTLDGTLLQDFGVTGGAALSEWTWTHRGETVEFEYVPRSAGTRGIRGQVTIEATVLGGDVKAKPTSDFSWDIIGSPTFFTPPGDLVEA